MLPLAAAIELIHTYSLIHDDLPAMDDDELRRGRPTCHVEFGEDVAILAGDGLFAEAFRLVLRRSRRASPRACSPRVARARRARPGVDGMVGGQYIDVARRRARGADGPARAARAEDRPADRRERRVRTACSTGWPRPAIDALPALRRASSACSSRSSTTSST